MRILCPHCGERGLEEFLYHGDATLARPDAGAAVAAWTDYVYLRDNGRGAHREFWYHAGGCQGWLVVTRDLDSHEMLGVAAARDGQG